MTKFKVNKNNLHFLIENVRQFGLTLFLFIKMLEKCAAQCALKKIVMINRRAYLGKKILNAFSR